MNIKRILIAEQPVKYESADIAYLTVEVAPRGNSGVTFVGENHFKVMANTIGEVHAVIKNWLQFLEMRDAIKAISVYADCVFADSYDIGEMVKILLPQAHICQKGSCNV